MPHQCTNCDRTFADGSKEMLSGCPECGGTKFQFRPDGFDDSPAGDDASGSTGRGPDDGGVPGSAPDSPPEPTDRPGDSVSRTVGNAAATVRDLVGGSAGSDATDARPPAESTAAETGSAGTADTSGPANALDPANAPDSADGLAGGDDDIIVAESDPGTEDTAQADARSQLVDPDEMPDSEGFDPADEDGPAEADGPTDADAPSDAGAPPERVDAVDGAEPGADAEADAAGSPSEERSVAEQPDAERADRPDLAELREELNDQFESIRVVEPGQYELNLMELYDREEYIIALQEDGRYSIQVPETWRQADA
ncbi:OapC/ArvC family zinc-ribbon domain-containing protein [Halosimplex halophilum]|uniref:OapC/ArvC family zinc-ribbon domain-containing protein n=1 Tax=Halosimplex halophilum TaxID=2559572 RepID=UPI00107F331B|nr:Zn-ribbon containing protein [Halosimplex halophilum]